MKYYYFIYLFMFFNVYLFGNEHNLIGYVYDSEINKPIENVVVWIVEKDRYATTDKTGFFNFGNLEEGNYKIKFNHLSYKEKIIDFKLNSYEKNNIVVYLISSSIQIAPVVVNDFKSSTVFDDLYELSGVLKGKELDKDLGITLAQTLKNETGIAMRSMGPAPARPVIRGLGGDRVLISENGNKTNDLSSTSPDHAMSVEPFTIDKIEVVRGPKVLMYTTSTIGGVVNIVRNEISEVIHNQIYGSLGFFGETANKGALGSFVAEIPVDPFSGYFEFSKRAAGDINTPVGRLKNSYSETINFATGLSFVKENFVLGLSLRNYDLSYGIPGGFIGAHPFGVDIKLRRKQFNVKTNYKLSGEEGINVNYSYSAYAHTEFEYGGKTGAEFKVVNHLTRIDYRHSDFLFLKNGVIGIVHDFKDFNIGGYVFTSPSKSNSLSTFIFESLNFGKFSAELSGRYNYDKIDPRYKGELTSIGLIREREFNTYSLSFSGLYQISDVVFVGGNVSKSSRVPTIEELYSKGPHLAAYSYEIGNPNLEEEKGIGTEIFLYHKFEDLFFNFTIFRNQLSYYIIPRNTGELNYSTFLPIYESQGIKALFWGYELQTDIKISEKFKLSASVSYTAGKNRTDNLNLPQIPPLKGSFEITYNGQDYSGGVSAEFASEQNKTDLFETSTAGYLILNGFIQYSFEINNYINNLSLNIDNIFNKEYRNHLSRVKSIMPETGINMRLTYRVFFHL